MAVFPDPLRRAFSFLQSHLLYAVRDDGMDEAGVIANSLHILGLCAIDHASAGEAKAS